MFDPMRNNHKLSFIEPEVAITKFDQQPSFDYKKEFILHLMVMPYKLPFELDQLYMRFVDFPDNLWTPVILKGVKLLRKIHNFKHKYLLRNASTMVYSFSWSSLYVSLFISFQRMLAFSGNGTSIGHL